MDDLSQKTARAMKWSSITEFATKIIPPLINMLLARILAPEAFGMLTTVTMVISFAEIFVDAGFQKFLIQHNFESKQREQEFMSVAFWTNLVFSFAIWIVIIIFRNPFASLAGNDGLGFPIALTGVTIPLFGIIGIQNCRLKKHLEFKKLFCVRFISSLIPLVVTLPLALLELDYWSLIIGNIAGVVVRSVVLAAIGKFVPSRYFSFSDLRNMMKFGIWTMLDGIAVWLTAWVDALLIARYMSEYYLGLYKTSISTITAIFGIITAALMPVLFSVLSKLQDDQERFNGMFLKTQRMLCVFLLPLSAGMYFYRGLITEFLFGAGWSQAADIVGIMAVTTALRTIFISFCSDVYRAKGRFYIPLIRQIVDLAILIPVCILSVQSGFWSLVYARAFVKLNLIPVDAVLLWILCGISPKATAKIVAPSAMATTVMIGAILLLQMMGTSFLWSFVSIALCALLYFAVLLCFPTEREIFLAPVRRVLLKKR